jgi:branched-chain amino acid aminotransferase
MPLLANLNGTIAETAQISVLDRGFLYGDSVYEVVRTFQGRPFGLQEHLDRLRQSAAYLYIDIPWSDAAIQAEVDKTLARAGWPESYVRIVVTRGAESFISLQPSADLRPNLLIVVSSISPEPVLSETGLHVMVPQRLRNSKRALDPAAKTGNYLNNILALLEAQQQGAEDALLLNERGEVTEATTSNIWIVRDGVVQTPPGEVGILQGITRQFLFQILAAQQIPYAETVLYPEDVTVAQEAFLSSSVRLLMPVRQVNDTKLPNCPGPMTRFLWQSLLSLMTKANAELSVESTAQHH